MSNEINNIGIKVPMSFGQELQTDNLALYKVDLPEYENDSFVKETKDEEKKNHIMYYLLGGFTAATIAALALAKHAKIKNPFSTKPAKPKRKTSQPSKSTAIAPRRKKQTTPKQIQTGATDETTNITPAKPSSEKPVLPPKVRPTVDTSAISLEKLRLPGAFADAKITDEEFFRKMEVLRGQLIEHYKNLGDMKEVRRLQTMEFCPAQCGKGYTHGRMNVLDALYTQLRKTSYTAEESIVNKNIDEITAATNKHIKHVSGESWNYRYPERRVYTTTRRYSVNAQADGKLIYKLDRFLAENKIKGYYKTPKTGESWCKRHDPITIYLEEPLSPELERQLTLITSPHIRSGKNVLLGEKVAPGLSKDFEPTREQTITLYEAIKKINPRMAKYLLGNEKGFSHPTSAWSAGQLKNVIDYVKFMTSPKDYNIFEATKIV